MNSDTWDTTHTLVPLVTRFFVSRDTWETIHTLVPLATRFFVSRDTWETIHTLVPLATRFCVSRDTWETIHTLLSTVPLAMRFWWDFSWTTTLWKDWLYYSPCQGGSSWAAAIGIHWLIWLVPTDETIYIVCELRERFVSCWEKLLLSID